MSFGVWDTATSPVTACGSRESHGVWCPSREEIVRFALFFAKRTISSRLGHQTPWDSRDPHAVTGLVAVSQTPNDMVFHIPGCSHLHGKPKFLQVEEAIREGYSPCPICIGKYTRQKKG